MRQKIRFFALLVCLLMMTIAAWAGVNDYSFTQTAGTYAELTGTTVSLFSNVDNSVSAATNIGFSFVYNGTTFTQFRASSNGFISLGATAPSTTSYTPISTPVINTIAAAAINGYTVGSCITATQGSSPNLVRVIQYTQYRTVSSTGTNALLTFQIRLYETTNVVEIIYGASTLPGLFTSYDLQVGLRGTTAGTDYSNRAGANWAASTAGGTNSATMSFSNNWIFGSSSPASGQTYKWTPPPYTYAPASISRLLPTNTSQADFLTINSTGTVNLTITAVTDAAAWLSYSPSLPVTVIPAASYDLNLTLDATGMAAGTYTTTLQVTTNAGNISVPVSLKVIDPALGVPNNPRHVAQWEPARGAIITYSSSGTALGIPDELIQDLYANNDELFVVVSSGAQGTAQATFNSILPDTNRIKWITAPSNTYWIRDYGPMSIYHGPANNRVLGIVDFGYNRTNRANDNAVNTAICNQLSIPRFYAELSLTGGNIVTDGLHQEFADEWVYLQNDTDTNTGNGTGDNADPFDYRYTPTEFLDLVETYRGDLAVDGFHSFPDPTDEYIHHIDCWAKLLSVDTVLIADGMTGPTETALDAIAAQWGLLTASNGNPYTVIRVQCPANQPYTNSYILNNRVYIPFMGNTATDNAALAVYQAAMPGYTVKGYTSGSAPAWVSTDALHCRVHTIYKMEGEDPLPVELSSFTATISSTNYALLTWVTQSETNVSGFNIYRGTSPDLQTALHLNAFIEATNTSQQQTYVYHDTDIYEDGLYYYWLESLDLDGTNEYFGPISISIGNLDPGTPSIPLVTEMLPPYPNPFNPTVKIPYSLKESGNVEFAIYNTRGQLVRSIKPGVKNSGHYQEEWDGRDSLGQPCATGVYHFRMTVGSQSYYRKAVLLK